MKKKINIIIQKIKEYKAFMYVLISICFSGLVDLFFTEMMIFDNYVNVNIKMVLSNVS